MARTAADVLVDGIIDWGVDVIFGLPGDGINGIMETLRKRQDRIRFVQVRHEESAAFMACAYAKVTGRLGVCLATSGPGGLHLINGLYDAKLDGAPVLAITGHHYHDLIDTHAQQDVDLTRVFEDVAVYNTRVMGFDHVASVTDLACRTALAYHGVAHICFPTDMQDWTRDEASPSPRNVGPHTSDRYAAARGVPPQAALRRAADILNGGSKVAIMAGAGALGAGDQLEQLAEKLAGPIIKPLLGKGVVPDDSPYTTGGIGLLGTAPSEKALKDCDTLLMVGTSFPYFEFLPKPGTAKAVQIDIDPARIGLRYPVDVGLVGDSCATLDLLLPLLERKDNRSFLEQAQKGMHAWWRQMDMLGQRDDTPMKPQVPVYELNKRLDDDAIVVSDSGTITTWWARHVKARRGQKFTLSGTLATMACGLPYALGAQVAYPDRQVVAVVGDGGFTMLMGDLVTAVKYKLPIKVIVYDNSVLGQIKWEQMVFLGNPEFGVKLQPIDFAKYAEAAGAAGFRVDDPKMCGDVMDQFLKTPGPALLQAVVDPLEPPLPAEIKPEQALKLTEALVRGEPDGYKILANATTTKVRELV